MNAVLPHCKEAGMIAGKADSYPDRKREIRTACRNACKPANSNLKTLNF
jgi:hypothetical protein|tara:strand:+ start:11387 stop:11533 length:147 start_codon:yes stop_codon:yes gene_type:complete